MVPTAQRLSDHLQRMVAARHPERTFEVLLARLPHAEGLPLPSPQLVIVWVGVNDLWNPLETESWPTPIRGYACNAYCCARTCIGC